MLSRHLRLRQKFSTSNHRQWPLPTGLKSKDLRLNSSAPSFLALFKSNQNWLYLHYFGLCYTTGVYQDVLSLPDVLLSFLCFWFNAPLVEATVYILHFHTFPNHGLIVLFLLQAFWKELYWDSYKTHWIETYWCILHQWWQRVCHPWSAFQRNLWWTLSAWRQNKLDWAGANPQHQLPRYWI